ncbi:hypothetical protein KDH_22060 [Dictyobacter sp. S3.2.2.5]|uniref:DUF5673 domain-containing protein n=1 Tax=Dictyobacter halimunensis TaxID=3026934 RepID=A0ABQ6FNT2_9CHLR|nr:hypothetical protein KDH_22060 [Dictyobacter sp. S3.2.2.5]
MRDVSASPIKKNPDLRRYRLNCTMSMVTIVCCSTILLAYVVVFFLLRPPLEDFLAHNRSIFWWLFIEFMFIFSYVSTRATLFYWQWIEQRRQAAVLNDHVWDAAEQPVANLEALDLPATITLRAYTPPKGRERFKIIGSVLAYIIVISALCAWSGDLLTVISQNRLYDFLFMFVLLILLAWLLFRWLRSAAARIKIVATEQGIRMDSSLVKWEEARLFAMYKNLNASGATYELSSARDIVRWTVFPSPAGLSTEESPYTVPADESSQQVRALNELIVARTGLPLSDLR